MQEQQCVLLEDVKKRLHKKNQNWLCVVVGPTGSGKTYSAMRIAEQLDSTFDITRVAFTPEEFMNLINYGELPKGSIIIVDEAGIALSAREWYSKINIAINKIMQMFRYRNLGVIFTTPDWGFVDSATRKLFHTVIETQGINRSERYVLVKWKNIQVNPLSGKPYTKYKRAVINNQYSRIDRVKIKKPSVKLVHAYEKKKTEFGKRLGLREEHKLKRAEERRVSTRIKDISDIVKTINSNLDYYTKEYSNRRIVDLGLIRAKFNIGRGTAEKVKSVVEKELENAPLNS